MVRGPLPLLFWALHHWRCIPSMIRFHILLAVMCSFATAHAVSPADVWPSEKWETATPAEAGLDEPKLLLARDYALTGEGSGMIVRHGKMVLSWGDQAALYDLKSSSKSIGVTVLGLALKDGKVKL